MNVHNSSFAGRAAARRRNTSTSTRRTRRRRSTRSGLARGRGRRAKAAAAAVTKRSWKSIRSTGASTRKKKTAGEWAKLHWIDTLNSSPKIGMLEELNFDGEWMFVHYLAAKLEITLQGCKPKCVIWVISLWKGCFLFDLSVMSSKDFKLGLMVIKKLKISQDSLKNAKHQFFER